MTSSEPGLGPAIPRRRLGAELKRLRDEHRKTLADVAADLLVSTSKLSRIEKGHAAPSERDLRDLLAYFEQIDSELGTRMRNWAREGRELPWWQEEDPPVDPLTANYLQYETAAHEISGYVEHFMPSLLQTPDYARSLISVMNADEPARIEQLVNVRLRRQEVLHRTEYPASLDVVIDESVFHRAVGSGEIMREQVRALAASTRMPTVTLRVLRFAAGPHPAMAEGSFSIFRFRRQIDPDVVNIEGSITDSTIDQTAQVDVYRRLLDGLREQALDPASSADFIRRMSQSY